MEVPLSQRYRRVNMRVRFAEALPGEIAKALLAAGGQQTGYPASTIIIQQGEPADWVHYVWRGKVQLLVLSKQGKEGAIGQPLSDGAFIGVGGLAGDRFYLASVTAVSDCEVIKITCESFGDLIKTNPVVGMAFTAFLLKAGSAIEAELVDHLFNSSEKRLARTLLLLANFGEEGRLQPIANMSQECLAHRVGTTRGRISHFMNKFRRLGLIDYNKKSIKVHSGLLDVVLRDPRLQDDQ